MTGQRGFLSEVSPLLTSSPQPDAPMGAPFDANFAFQTQAVAFRELGSQKTLFWPNARLSPTVTTNLINTDVIMQNPTVDLEEVEIGWLAHPNAQSLGARFYLAIASFDLLPEISIETKTLISAVATTQGPGELVRPQMEMPAITNWGIRNVSAERWKLGYGTAHVKPEYPADRTLPFVVQFKGRWAADANPTNISIERTMAMMAVDLFDIIPPPDPES